MSNLLTEHGYLTMLKNIAYSEVIEASKVLTEVVDNDYMFSAAVAYRLGICQGVHDERARRKARRMEREVCAV